MRSTNRVIITSLALAGVLCAGAAQAYDGSDVQWSVTFAGPIGVTIGSAYAGPFGAVVAAPHYRYTAPVYAPRHNPWSEYGAHRPPRWDADGDGIPNRVDRVYNPRWDRDGDGIANRHDRVDNWREGRGSDRAPGWRGGNERREGGRR